MTVRVSSMNELQNIKKKVFRKYGMKREERKTIPGRKNRLNSF
jgi:hypothetical protein